MERLARIKDVEFVGMCDVDEKKAAGAAGKYAGKVFTDYRRMLDQVKTDCCYICVPPFAHVGQELLCVEKNIPFFVEKPIELDLKKAKAIARKVQEKRLITGVGYVLRYFDVVEKARKILAQEEIGMLRGRYYGGVPGDGKGWYSQKKLSAGQLVEQATHTVDMMRNFAGDVTEVFGYAFEGINKKIYEKYDVEDASTTVMKFKNGLIGNMSCTWLATGYQSNVEVVGKGVTVFYEGTTLTVDRHTEKTIYTTSMDCMLAEDQAFIEDVKKGRPNKIKSDYLDGLKTLAVSLAALESFRTGKPVKLDV